LLGLAGALGAEDGATWFAERCAAGHGPDGHAKTPAGRKVGAAIGASRPTCGSPTRPAGCRVPHNLHTGRQELL
jgi:hypothetical protein